MTSMIIKAIRRREIRTLEAKRKTPLRTTTKLACEIAETNPDRFNEAVHAGFYPCAPQTTPGKARSFGADDIVALRLYQGFIKAGMSAATAGAKACKIRQFMETHPDAPMVFIIGTAFDPVDYLLAEFDLSQPVIDLDGTQVLEVTSCEVINLDWHRERVVHYITEADKERVVGD